MDAIGEYIGNNVKFSWVKQTLFPATLIWISLVCLLAHHTIGLEMLPMWWINITQEARIFSALLTLLILLVSIIIIVFSRTLLDNWIRGNWDSIPLLNTYYAMRSRQHLIHAIKLRDRCNVYGTRLVIEGNDLSVSEKMRLYRQIAILSDERQYYPYISKDSTLWQLTQKSGRFERVFQMYDLKNSPEISSNTFSATRIGNILQSAAAYPETQYGLSYSTWIPLYFALPKDFIEELESKHTEFVLSVQLMFVMAILGGIFARESFYFVVLFFLAFWLFRVRAIYTSKVYADVFRSAYDLYRFKIYDALHMEPPTETGENELNSGKKLSEFLRSPSMETKPLKYLHPHNDDTKELV